MENGKLKISALVCLFLFAFCLLPSAFSQSIRWEPGAGSLAHGKVSELQLIFDDCAPKTEPTLPATPGITLQRVGQSENTSILNGSVNRSLILTYAATPNTRAQVSIPSFTVSTDKGNLTVPAATYDVGDATVGRGNVSLESVARSKFTAPASVWAGEVFTIKYDLTVARRYFESLGSNLEWNPAPLILDEWPKPTANQIAIGGEAHVIVNYQTQALAKTPGTLALEPATQITNLITGTSNMGFFGPQTRAEPYIIKATAPALTVKALPTAAPASFAGAVGQFTLESKLVPASAAPGEPVTWTLTLKGVGNWPDVKALPSRSVAKSFRVVSPDPKRTPKEGTLFEASLSEDIVLVPTTPGNFTLGPVTWTYFDPAKGIYVPITTPAHTLTVTAAPVTGTAGLQPGQISAQPSNAATAAAQSATPKLPAAPQTLPRNPLSAADLAPTPLRMLHLVLFALAPLLLLPLVWLALAYRHAVKNDPERHRRAAFRRLQTTLAQLPAATEKSALLQAWQADTVQLLGLRTAAPSAELLAAAFARLTQAETWQLLWREAEATLYAPRHALPADWVSRAQLALASYQLPAFSSGSLFRSRHLFPFAAALALLLAPPQTPLSASESPTTNYKLPTTSATESYSAGQFTAAEKSWRDQLKATSADSALRHNLSLALAQQNRWGEAAAHAAAATLQNPAVPAYRAQLTLALNQAGYLPTLFSDISRSSWATTTTALLSPAQWQHVLLASSATLTLGFALLLAASYFRPAFALKLSGQILCVLATLAFSHAVISLWQYGPLTDTRAALVWKTTTLRSIPTDTNAEQKTSPLEAGHVVIVDRTFLTWSHLAFPDGKTGWLRTTDLVSLWK